MDPYDVKYFRMISRKEMDDFKPRPSTHFKSVQAVKARSSHMFVIQLLHMPFLYPKFLDILTNYLEFNTINLDNETEYLGSDSLAAEMSHMWKTYEGDGVEMPA